MQFIRFACVDIIKGTTNGTIFDRSLSSLRSIRSPFFNNPRPLSKYLITNPISLNKDPVSYRKRKTKGKLTYIIKTIIDMFMHGMRSYFNIKYYNTKNRNILSCINGIVNI